MCKKIVCHASGFHAAGDFCARIASDISSPHPVGYSVGGFYLSLASTFPTQSCQLIWLSVVFYCAPLLRALTLTSFQIHICISSNKCPGHQAHHRLPLRVVTAKFKLETGLPFLCGHQSHPKMLQQMLLVLVGPGGGGGGGNHIQK